MICFLRGEKLNNLSVQISTVISHHHWWSSVFSGEQRDLMCPMPWGWPQKLVPAMGTDCKCIHWLRMLRNILQGECIYNHLQCEKNWTKFLHASFLLWFLIILFWLIYVRIHIISSVVSLPFQSLLRNNIFILKIIWWLYSTFPDQSVYNNNFIPAKQYRFPHDLCF